MIGRLYVGHLEKAFDHLLIFDLDPEAVELAAEQGATSAASAKELASRCDRIILSLPSPSAVEAALVGPDGILEGAAAGTVVLDLSTIDPFTAKRMYAAAREKGVSYLDSPVSGGASYPERSTGSWSIASTPKRSTRTPSWTSRNPSAWSTSA